MSIGLTRTDLSDATNKRDCAEEFRRARDGLGGSLRVWARKWGDAIVTEIDDPTLDEEENEHQIEVVRAPLKVAIEKAIADLEPIADKMGEKDAEPLEKIISALEKAIAE